MAAPPLEIPLSKRSTARKGLLALIVLLVLLALLRIAGPYVATWVVNQRLAELGDFSGHIDDLDFAIWRGAYSIDGLTIVKRSGEVPVPFFKAHRIDLSIRWRALLRGVVAGEAEFRQPELNFVDARSKDAEQSGRGVDWRGVLQDLFPIQIDHLAVHDGTIHFRNFGSNPPVNLTLSELQATATNLSNAKQRTGEHVARLEAKARALGGAPVEITAEFDPFERLGDFHLQAETRDVQVKELNDFARAYAKVDLSSGTATVLLELRAEDRQLNGLVKPIFHDLEILEAGEISEKLGKPHNLGWEIFTELMLKIFSNWKEDQFAACIPLSGSLDQRDVAVLPAIFSVLRNAFIDAFERNLDEDCPEPKPPKQDSAASAEHNAADADAESKQGADSDQAGSDVQPHAEADSGAPSAQSEEDSPRINPGGPPNRRP